jgi:cyclopropane fatty-acyl-phospholipid synthase-like methyltransferase
MDRSNGWDAIAPSFIEDRERSRVGVDVLAAWCRGLATGAAVLDLGCGPGGPRSRVLVDHGFDIYAVDASPALAEAYRQAIAGARVACEAAEESAFFDRTFDGVVAWGLMFLLAEDTQRIVITRVANALRAGGRFLFTAPSQVCTWNDLSTNRASRSLGATAYRAALATVGLRVVAEYVDDGDNHYYDAQRP